MDSSDIFQDTGADRVDEYEEELTAAEVLQKLEDAWLNEKHSPELLEPKIEIVECMLEQVKCLLIFSILEHLNHKNRDCSINTPHNLLRPKVRQRRRGGLE